MPIRPQHRWLYLIDWQQLTNTVRFERAKGRCECCAKPHGQLIYHLGGQEVLQRFPFHLRYAIGSTALVLSALGVNQAITVPRLEDFENRVSKLPPSIDGYPSFD